MTISFDYPGRYSVTLERGIYFLEVWGAQGGIGIVFAQTPPGYGSFSKGILSVNRRTTVYVYVGGQGAKYGKGGFNGGGNTTNNAKSAGGGEATDIRIGLDDLHARVIVAGGGGGVEYSYENSYGGSGGGETGGSGFQSNLEVTGATQEAPGSHYGEGTSPGFGIGGSATLTETGGGGGGWYGGGASKTNAGEGSGGSGYVFTKETYKYYPSPKISKEYFLLNAMTVQGNITFLSPAGSAETGHRGNGAARITKLGSFGISCQCYKKCHRVYFGLIITLIS